VPKTGTARGHSGEGTAKMTVCGGGGFAWWVRGGAFWGSGHRQECTPCRGAGDCKDGFHDSASYARDAFPIKEPPAGLFDMLN